MTSLCSRYILSVEGGTQCLSLEAEVPEWCRMRPEERSRSLKCVLYSEILVRLRFRNPD